MLSRRIAGGFVCLRCQLSLAIRGSTRLNPPRTSKANTALRIAPTRSYSDSPARQNDPHNGEETRKPEFEGQSSVDKSHNGEDPWQGEQSPDTKKPARNGRPEAAQSQDAGGAQDPWERAFEDRLEAGKKAVEGKHVRHRQHENTQDRPQERHRQQAFRKAPVRSRRAPPPLNTGPAVYTAKGQRLRPTNQELPIDILGKPAHALVLRDAGPMRKKNIQRIDPDPLSDTASSISLASIYESTQLDAPSSAEVLSNIHELQPAATVLPRREFEALKNTLFKGFTKAQLAAYIQNFASAAKDSNKGALQLTRPWILEKRPWAPEVESVGGAADALLHGYVAKSTSPKEKLVVGLMRQCWGLAIQELQSQPGYLDVKVQDLQFQLLMLGNRRWLESISRSLFEPGTQIELIRSERIVRIVAPKTTAELILQEINSLLDQARTRALDAVKISPERLDQSILDEVSQITHTVVRYDASGSNIEVSWIASADDDRREGLEDLADVVYRLLYSAYGYRQPGAVTMEVQPEPYAVGGWYLVDYHSKGKMAWKDRLAKWARWQIATPLRGAKPAASYGILENNLLCRSLDQPSAPLSFSPDGWSSEPQVTTKAVFGHVLHREPAEPDVEEAFEDEAVPEDSPLKLPYNRNAGIHDKLDWTLCRTLAPRIPPLSSLAALTSASPATTTTSTTILLRFLPAPTNNPSPSLLPALELTLLVHADSDTATPSPQPPTPVSLRAITHVSTHDILLPSRAVDLRLTDTTSHLLPGGALATHAPALARFLAASDLRPHDGVLATPARPGAPLRLPARVFASAADKSGDGTGEGEEGEAGYLFAGLELRRSVAAAVRGWRLTYTSVEAGQGGGRRAELALEGVRMDGGGGGGENEERLERSGDLERPRQQDLEVSSSSPSGEEMAPLAEVPAGTENQEKKEMTDAEGYVETLSRLVVGDELSWFGEMPGGGPAKDKDDGEASSDDGRGPVS